MSDKLLEIKEACEITISKIDRLLKDKSDLEQAIQDLKYLKRHSGEMIFTGNSGRINERDVMLRKVKVNTLGGCVAVPDLLIELAEKKLIELSLISELLANNKYGFHENHGRHSIRG